MTISKTTIKEIEHTYRRPLPDDLKQYLLVKYAEEPFPYEFSEQDLHSNILHDICDYEAGKLDVTVKSPSVRWREEREYLRNIYIEKAHEVHEREEYISELEYMLTEQGLESSRMAERRITVL